MKTYNLTPLAEEWFVAQFDALVNNNAEQLNPLEFDVREFERFVVRYVYDYQLTHQWYSCGEIARMTAKICHYEERQIRRIIRGATKK